MNWLNKYSDSLYTVLRIVVGFTFAFHGMQKLFGVWSEFVPPVASQLWFAGIIEFFGGLMIMLGLMTSWAAFLCSGEMAVAYFQVHWKIQLGKEFFPTINKGELALVYCFLFLYIASRGYVKFGLDKLLSRNK